LSAKGADERRALHAAADQRGVTAASGQINASRYFFARGILIDRHGDLVFSRDR
jgi:hypothetical protein